jgi:hypothetical protein
MNALDATLIAQSLLTLETHGYGLDAMLADFNRTHATNPLWSPHARFHVVWQITSYAGFGLLALVLIWLPGPSLHERLALASIFAVIVYGAFFVALAGMPLYGGRTHDENGVHPFVLRIGGVSRRLDVNVSAFSILSLTLGAAVAMLIRA